MVASAGIVSWDDFNLLVRSDSFRTFAYLLLQGVVDDALRLTI